MPASPDLTTDTQQARDLRYAMVQSLARSGILRSRAWRSAFEHVPRHTFVPRYLVDDEHNGQYRPLTGAAPDQYDEWLRRAYDDDVCVTQLNGDDTAWHTAIHDGHAEGTATCSASQPSLIALMLEALNVEHGATVLEIGTGTGYNAALLTHRLGRDAVTSVDIDPVLVYRARSYLFNLGYTPTVEAIDGTLGYAKNAPYDRVLATCSFPYVPPNWITQTKPGGMLLVNLYRPLGGGALAQLTVTDDGTAEGSFSPEYAGFMLTRSEPEPHTLQWLNQARQQTGDTRETDIDGAVLDDKSFAFFAALCVPAVRIGLTPQNGNPQTWLLADDGSWAMQTTGKHGRRTVTEHGPQPLWEHLEAAYVSWLTSDRPTRERFGITATEDGQHTFWLDHPSQPLN